MTGLFSKLRGFVTPVAAVAGAALVSYGAALVYRPAGFIVGGLLLVLGALDLGA